MWYDAPTMGEWTLEERAREAVTARYPMASHWRDEDWSAMMVALAREVAEECARIAAEYNLEGVEDPAVRAIRKRFGLQEPR